ncbi:CD63 antigen [Aphomia sociella]
MAPPTPVSTVGKMKFTKTESEYNMKSIRFLLLTITAMFIIIGVLMIVLGISVYTQYHSFSFFYESAMNGRFFTPSLLSVFIGLTLVIVTAFGFCGSLKQSTCMVNSYAMILGIILTMKLIIVILAFTMDRSTVMKYVYLPISEYPKDTEIRAEIDTLQATLNCCGSTSYLDYAGMEFATNDTVTVKTTPEEHQNIVIMDIPRSCCAVIDRDACLRMRSVGCQDALINALVQNASVLGVLGVSVMFIMLLGIIFALLLARSIRRHKSERMLMEWRIREQIILARQEVGKKTEDNQVMYIVTSESSVA